MMNVAQTRVVLVAVLAIFSVAGLAQQPVGQETYVARCQGCHGKTGLAETPMANVLKVRSVNDPDVKKMTEAQMIDITRDGKNKMQAFKGKLTDQQIKESVDYFRSLAK